MLDPLPSNETRGTTTIQFSAIHLGISIELWLEYASTYSYLTVARIGRLSDEHGVEIRWQPFWLHPVREQAGLPPPFPDGSLRERYMWRDLERRAKLRNLPYRKPAIYPFNSVQVGRIALIGAREGWCREFTETAFRLHWTEGLAMTEPANTAAALARITKAAHPQCCRLMITSVL